MRYQVIRVCEYDTIKVGNLIGNIRFSEDLFRKLCLLNDREHDTYYVVGYKRITFCQFVGVIQFGSVSIEIYPKADRLAYSDDEEDLYRWRDLLIHMLYTTRMIKPKLAHSAALQTKKSPLIDLFILQFLDLVQNLVYQGLSRKYRKQEMNTGVLKGRLVFQKHFLRNQIHKERFFIETTVYDLNNPYNRIIKTALLVLAQSYSQYDRLIHRLLYSFDDIDPLYPASTSWDSFFIFNRTTERYKDVLIYARYVLEHLSPDVAAGGEHAIAFLFDMNQLFEKYVLHMVKRASSQYPDMQVYGQQSKLFWRARTIRPDIVIQHRDRTYILDTKWKIPEKGPSDSDLKQMYVYNQYWGSHDAFLIYPAYGYMQQVKTHATFTKDKRSGEYQNRVSTLFVRMEHQEGRGAIGRHIIDKVIQSDADLEQAYVIN